MSLTDDFINTSRQKSNELCAKSVQDLKDEIGYISPFCARTEKWDEEVDGNKDVRVSGEVTESAQTISIRVGNYTIVAENAIIYESSVTHNEGDFQIRGNLTVDGNIAMTGALNINGVLVTKEFLTMLGAPSGPPPIIIEP